MRGCEELRRDAGGFAALATDDPERVAAFAHARGCPGCAAALREGERLVALLDALPPEPAPSAALRRAAAPVLESLSRAPPRLAVPLAAAAAAVLLVVAARSHSPAPRDQVAAAVLLAAALAAAALAGRGLVTIAGAGLVSIAFAVAGGGPGAVHASEGLRCAACELFAAALPVLAMLARWPRGRIGPRTLAAAGAAGALAGQAALELVCHAPHAAAHLLVFHAGTVVAAAALAAVPWARLGRRPHAA